MKKLLKVLVTSFLVASSFFMWAKAAQTSPNFATFANSGKQKAKPLVLTHSSEYNKSKNMQLASHYSHSSHVSHSSHSSHYSAA